MSTPMAWIDQRGSEVLARNECIRLLAVGAGGVGRIGFVENGHVQVEPVNYRMLDHDVVVQLGPGSMLDAADKHEVVSFEVDHTTGVEAWSVVVRGPARHLDPDAPPDLARPRWARPLVPDPGASFVVLRTDVVSGRRFPLRALFPFVAGTGGRGLHEIDLRPPVGVGRDATIREAAAAMEASQVSSVLLGEQPSWLVSEHDLVGGLAAGLGPDDPAGDVATRTPLWVTTASTVADAGAMMTRHCVQHIVVIRPDGVPVGVLSRREVLRQLLADHDGERSR